MNLTFLHLISIFSFLLYLFYVLNVSFAKYSKRSELILLFSLLSHFITILLLVSKEYGSYEAIYYIESSPSLVLLICSFILFIIYYLVKERSKTYSISFTILGLLLFFISSLGMHVNESTSTYKLSSVLLVHILFSILSQVSVFFILLFSFLIMLLHRSLKKKQLGLLNLPDMFTLEKMLTVSLQGVIFFLFISLSSGVLQKELSNVHLVKLLISFVYFILFALFLVTFTRKKIATGVLSFYLFGSTFIMLFFQLLLRFI